MSKAMSRLKEVRELSLVHVMFQNKTRGCGDRQGTHSLKQLQTKLKVYTNSVLGVQPCEFIYYVVHLHSANHTAAGAHAEYSEKPFRKLSKLMIGKMLSGLASQHW